LSANGDRTGDRVGVKVDARKLVAQIVGDVYGLPVQRRVRACDRAAGLELVVVYLTELSSVSMAAYCAAPTVLVCDARLT
jgi:hypothetical protein